MPPTSNKSSWIDDFMSSIRNGLKSSLRCKNDELEESRRQYDTLVARIPIGVYILRTTANGGYHLDYASDRFAAMFGTTVEKITADQSIVFKSVHPADRADFLLQNAQSQNNADIFDWTGRFLIGGRETWRYFHSVPEIMPNGDIIWHGILEDVTERKLLEEQTKQLANHDALTKLPNRRLLLDRLTFSMALSNRSERYAALMFLDLDHFKTLNDTYGHAAGDQLLIETAKRLLKCVRETDTVARFGGDEFVVLLGDLEKDQANSAAKAASIAEQIRHALSVPFDLTALTGESFQYHSAASVVVEMFRDHETGLNEIIAHADAAMYEAKKAGRNAVRFYTKPIA